MSYCRLGMGGWVGGWVKVPDDFPSCSPEAGGGGGSAGCCYSPRSLLLEERVGEVCGVFFFLLFYSFKRRVAEEKPQKRAASHSFGHDSGGWMGGWVGGWVGGLKKGSLFL